jgi:hypothetical protein
MHATLPLKTAGITMLPIIRLSQAWLDAHGWSNAEGASLLEIDRRALSRLVRLPQQSRRHDTPAHHGCWRADLQVKGLVTSNPDRLTNLCAIARARVLVGLLKHYSFTPVTHAIRSGLVQIRADRPTKPPNRRTRRRLAVTRKSASHKTSRVASHLQFR